MGFHVDVGPLNVFVSTHLIPSDLKFDPNAESPQYASEDQVIQKGAMIRLKIINARMDSTEIVSSFSPSPSLPLFLNT